MIHSQKCTGCGNCNIDSMSEYICYLSPQALITGLKNITLLLDKAPVGKYLSGLRTSISCTGKLDINNTTVHYINAEEVLADKRDTRGYPFRPYSVLCAALYEILQQWYTNRQYLFINDTYGNNPMIQYSGISRFISGPPPITKNQVMTLIELLKICDSVYSSMDS